MTLPFAFFVVSHRLVVPAFAKEMLEIGAGGTRLLLLAAGLGPLLGDLVLASLGTSHARRNSFWYQCCFFLACCIVHLVSLVLGILDNIDFRRSNQFQAFHYTGNH